MRYDLRYDSAELKINKFNGERRKLPYSNRFPASPCVFCAFWFCGQAGLSFLS